MMPDYHKITPMRDLGQSVKLTSEQAQELRHKIWAYGEARYQEGRTNSADRRQRAANFMRSIRKLLPTKEED